MERVGGLVPLSGFRQSVEGGVHGGPVVGGPSATPLAAQPTFLKNQVRLSTHDSVTRQPPSVGSMS
ncbi:MAG: hypothetical protein CM1200mP26_30610 [Acidimicrobiales bacterium]|nr:MAG: hypothetical protein CM1200mP26_30610 [Acidimicrobiales bacterium]